MIEFLLNPWVISIIIISVVVGNIAALKYTANMKFGSGIKSQSEQNLDRLNQLDSQQKSEKVHSKQDDLKQ